MARERVDAWWRAANYLSVGQIYLLDIDRFHLVVDVIDRVSSLGSKYANLRQYMNDARTSARAYAFEHGEDVPSVRDWSWDADRDVEPGSNATASTGGDNE